MIVLDSHSNQEKRKLFDLCQHLALCLIFIGAEALSDKVGVGLMQVVGCDEIHFEPESFQEFHLSVKNLFLGESSMRYLL